MVLFDMVVLDKLNLHTNDTFESTPLHKSLNYFLSLLLLIPTAKCDDLVFFVQLNQLDELKKITHARIRIHFTALHILGMQTLLVTN